MPGRSDIAAQPRENHSLTFGIARIHDIQLLCIYVVVLYDCGGLLGVALRRTESRFRWYCGAVFGFVLVCCLDYSSEIFIGEMKANIIIFNRAAFLQTCWMMATAPRNTIADRLAYLNLACRFQRLCAVSSSILSSILY